MTESMIARVATAILHEQNKAAFPNNLDLARAAIEAMREPTEAQASVMYNLLERCDRPPTKRWHWVWHEMIDAALKWPAGSADRAGVPMARD